MQRTLRRWPTLWSRRWMPNHNALARRQAAQKFAFAPMSGWGMRGKLNDNKLKQIIQINNGTLSKRHEKYPTNAKCSPMNLHGLYLIWTMDVNIPDLDAHKLLRNRSSCGVTSGCMVETINLQQTNNANVLPNNSQCNHLCT